MPSQFIQFQQRASRSSVASIDSSATSAARFHQNRRCLREPERDTVVRLIQIDRMRELVPQNTFPVVVAHVLAGYACSR